MKPREAYRTLPTGLPLRADMGGGAQEAEAAPVKSEQCEDLVYRIGTTECARGG